MGLRAGMIQRTVAGTCQEPAKGDGADMCQSPSPIHPCHIWGKTKRNDDSVVGGWVSLGGGEVQDDVASCSWHMSTELEEPAKGDAADMQHA